MKREKFNKLIAFILTATMILGTAVFFSSADDSDTGVDSNSRLVFSGIELRRDSSGGVQALVDFNLRNITSTGFRFTLEYNTQYVQLSNMGNNAEVVPSTTALTAFYINGISSGQGNADTVLSVNSDIFDSPQDFTYSTKIMPASSGYGSLDFEFGVLSQRLSGAAVVDTDYVKHINKTYSGDTESGDQYVAAIVAGSENLRLGTISFKVKDPTAFVQLSPAALQEIFRVSVSASTSEALFEIQTIDNSREPTLIPLEDSMTNLAYEFNVQNMISKVVVSPDEATVTAAEIYGDGTENDLIAYLNKYMKDLTVIEMNGTEIPDTAAWSASAEGFSIDKTWDPKGGKTYNIEQIYNNDPSNVVYISAKVTVLPVNLTGITIEREIVSGVEEDFSREYINYTEPDPTADYTNRPSSKGDSRMLYPTRFRAVFDQEVPRSYILSAVNASGWTEISRTDAPSAVSLFDTLLSRVEGRIYPFKNEIDTSSLPEWATIPSTPFYATIYRGVNSGEAPAAPVMQDEPKVRHDITASVTDGGTLTISVANVPEGTTGIKILLPNGELLDSTNFGTSGSSYSVSISSANSDPASNSATITIKAADHSNDQQSRAYKYINAGGKLGDFKLAFVKPLANNILDASVTPPTETSAPIEITGAYTAFNFSPRANYYLADGSADSGYTYRFEYDAERAQLFLLEAGMENIVYQTDSDGNIEYDASGDPIIASYSSLQEVNTTVRLQGDDRVHTTYDGTDGSEIGYLKTVMVDSWDIYASYTETVYTYYTAAEWAAYLQEVGDDAADAVTVDTVVVDESSVYYEVVDGDDEATQANKEAAIAAAKAAALPTAQAEARAAAEAQAQSANPTHIKSTATNEVSDAAVNANKIGELPVGATLKFRGLLADTTYGGYGAVVNKSANIYLEIVADLSSNVKDSIDEVEGIETSEGYTFATQQAGYGKELLETHSFTIRNNGTRAITGLTVRIGAASSSEAPGAFELKSEPSFQLASGATTSFDISTVYGLPKQSSGEPYIATAYIYSSERLLASFKLSFLVTASETFRVKINILNDNNSGTVLLPGGTAYTAYTEGKATGTIAMKLQPKDDFSFGAFNIISSGTGGSLSSALDDADIFAVYDSSDDPAFTGYNFINAGSDTEGYTTYYYPMPDLSQYKNYVTADSDGKLVLEIDVYFAPSSGAHLRFKDFTVKETDSGKEYDLVDSGTYSKVSFDPNVREYTVILPASSESIDISGLLYDTADAAGVSVDTGDTVFAFLDEQIDSNWLPTKSSGSLRYGGAIANSYDSATGKFTISGLQTANIASAENDSDQVIRKSPVQNRVVISLKHTDNTVRRYTLNIRMRMDLKDMVRFAYGNSPYGLIDRMGPASAGGKGAWTAQRVRNAKAYFSGSGTGSTAIVGARRFIDGTSDQRAEGSGHDSQFSPDGATLNLYYSREAWASSAGVVTTDYDEDSSALFIYQGESFVDPGFRALYDSLGNRIDKTKVGDDWIDTVDANVSREIRDLIRFTYSADTFAENNIGLSEQFVTHFTTLGSTVLNQKMAEAINLYTTIDQPLFGGSASETDGTMVSRYRPGIYSIRYYFTDYDGSVINVERPLILMSKRGDLDISGTIESATDGNYIINRATNALPYRSQNYPYGNLYKFRIADANADRDINLADYNYVTYKAGGTASTERFYPPLSEL